jgi:uncharacterized protein YndB with AHSA1/START domain
MTSMAMLNVSAPGERDIVITRRFDAPRQMVFEAHTRPDLVSRWLLGPPGWTMPVCEIDLRIGGSYHYVWRNDTNGRQFGMGGVFREIAAPARLVTTEKFDESPYPGEAVNTLVLTEQGGQTLLTLTSVYPSREIRDIALKSGMEKGVGPSYDRLEALVAPGGTRA